MADLPSILGGMAQGFIDFGKGAVDLFGTGGAAIGDLVDTIRTGKVSTKNQDDFRKWLYNTDSVKDAAAKGLGTALNGVQTALDYIPGVNAFTRNPLGNAAQGALGGLADEFKTYGENYDLGRAGQRAAVSGLAAAASGSLADALKGSSNALLKSGTVQGLARGATSGAISGGGYAAIDGGDVLQSALQGAGTGALIGGATGAFQDFKPAKTYDMALTDDERAARIANAQNQIDDIGPVSRFSNNPDDIAKRARIRELQGNIRAYQNGYDTAQDYADAMAAKRANRPDAQAGTTQGQAYAPNTGEMEYGAPVQDGYTRLYRGMTQEFDPQYNRNAMDNMNGYESWTDNYDLANRYGDGKYVYSIDVPTSRIASSLYDENPNSATYGDRNFITAIEKAAGLDGIGGNEYLLNTNDELRSGLTYNRVNAPQQLEATLADADMAVNSPKLTPEQEAYFKDSVIRDENGNLMPLYHGSNSKFTVFDSSKSGQSNKTARVGHWFTPSEEGARNFANSVWYGDESEPTVYSTYLNVKNPKIYEAVDNSAQIKALNDEMDNLTRQLDGMRRGSDDFNATYKKYNDLAKQIDNLSYGDPYEQFRSDIYAMEGKTPYQANVGGLGMMMDDENAATQKYVQSLRDQGYDGIIIRGTDYDNGTLGGTNDQYVVFDSNQIKDINNLTPTDDPDIMASRMTPDELDLGRTLAGQDLSVNSAKIAPGQLGLFDDMPTQTPKTGTRQTSLFDQPQEGLDYYGEDIEAPVTTLTNPYAPVDGQVTQAMRDRASEIIDSLALKRQIPENELFNKIDPSTLPRGQQEIGRILDDKYSKGLKYSDVTDMMRETVSSEFDKRLGKNPSKEDLISFIFGNADETTKKEMMDKAIGLYVAPETMSEGTLNSMARNKISDSLYGDSISAINASNRTVRGGYTGALDSALSERLGIAPGNTFKKTGPYDRKGSYGRYEEYPSSPYKNNIMVDTRSNNEDAINTMAHERLHSFQTEAKKLYDKDRYSPEVKDAYDELAKDLKDARAYRTGKEIKERYGSDVAYWRHHDEQEARMLQQYLDAKGYTGSNHHNENRYLGLEYDDAKITPAFDKFFDKLRDLSKRGIALPALTALFGGGAYMASQNNDKEKEVK
jgi:hypothetical protein